MQDQKFEEHWFRDCTEAPLEKGVWGRRIQIFHHNFYGEGLEIEPGKDYTRPPTPKPYAGIVWSGAGELNGMPLDTSVKSAREFLVAPNHAITLVNTGSEPLLVYTAWPIVTAQAIIQDGIE